MPGVWRLLRIMIYMVVGSKSVGGNSDIWPLERPEGMPAIQSLEVMCGKDHMDVHLSFSQPFEGIVSSKGQHADPRCVYVPPSTGQTFFSFRIAYARCGTKPDMHGQFYENTVVVQYDKDLLEVWDEAKRLRCEWFNDYEKTASKPPMVIADLDVIQLDFRGDNVDCWMEIQHGKGPWAPPVSGIVPLGSTLTLVVAINDYRGEFDMRVKSCVASDGGGHTIQLSDEFGCVLRPKMISRFLKARGSDDRATVITYAFFHAFKFPDALSVHIKCKVEICRHGCLDHCQLSGSVGHYIQERKDQIRPQYTQTTTPPTVHSDDNNSAEKDNENVGGGAEQADGSLYDDIIQDGDEMTSIGGHFLGVEKSVPKAQAQTSNRLPAPVVENSDEEVQPDDGDLSRPFLDPPRVTRYEGDQDQFPHGPRNLEGDSGAVPSTPLASPSGRRRRSVVVSDRKTRSADVGVSGLYEVISEADLAFSPDTHAEAVTVFQGRIREEVVYGICLPMPGFSALFIVVALSAVVSALVAGAMLHRLQAQREAADSRKNNRAVHTTNGWLSYGLLRVRCTTRPAAHPEQIQQKQTSPVAASPSVERG
ncbi:zona pellucida domain-containing protein miniature [Calliopsis andreniformis]|uniref:zona pellucida domain-containing protein miniature n=1 Tax=Calliopsis andreniformis TaxID=337506 RepID=UPI003FCC8335